MSRKLKAVFARALCVFRRSSMLCSHPLAADVRTPLPSITVALRPVIGNAHLYFQYSLAQKSHTRAPPGAPP